jgi:hypothetical protein
MERKKIFLANPIWYFAEPQPLLPKVYFSG